MHKINRTGMSFDPVIFYACFMHEKLTCCQKCLKHAWIRYGPNVALPCKLVISTNQNHVVRQLQKVDMEAKDSKQIRSSLLYE